MSQPVHLTIETTCTLNILVPTTVLGGAERIVFETCAGLTKARGVSCSLFVLRTREPSYPLHELASTRVVHLNGMERARSSA